MQIGPDIHLTYCTNIHPGDDWAQVQASLAEYGPCVKQRVSPDAPFGIGLRLSNKASEELLVGDRMQAFRAQLACDGLYVFTMNGFPYGSFHRTAVKDLVHAPDWQTAERGDYTIRLARILAALLPDDMTEGSISTSPLSYKPWVWAQDGGDGPQGRAPSREGAVVSGVPPSLKLRRVSGSSPFAKATGGWRLPVCRASVAQLVRVTRALLEIERETGKLIHVDLEPEPDGLLETADEVCAFFRDHLLAYGAQCLGDVAGLSEEDSRRALLRHIGVCLDTCHLALEYETPRDFVAKMQDMDIRVGKVQISSALNVPLGEDPANLASVVNQVGGGASLPPLNVFPHRHKVGGRVKVQDLSRVLAPFVESTYLHQVIQRNADGILVRYRDLPEALEGLPVDGSGAREWRVHFHVPVFTDSCGAFSTTRQTILDTFDLLAEDPFTQHLEIETYTWEVLPEDLKKDLVESIAREFAWTLSVFPQSLSKGGTS